MKSIQLYSLSTIDFTLLVSPMLILSYLDLHLLQNQHRKDYKGGLIPGSWVYTWN